MSSKEKFDELIPGQFCDYEHCRYYNQIKSGNIRVHSRKKGQVYCVNCKNRWVVTKGTIWFGLKTPVNKIISTLLLMAKGYGLRKTCRSQKVAPDTVNRWIEKASEEMEEFNNYMNQEMKLEDKEIERFRKFIKNKTKNS